MKNKDKVSFELDDGVVVDTTFKVVDPSTYPMWYEQFLSLSDDKRKSILNDMLSNIKKEKLEAYEFIKKFKCKLVGIQPRVEYCLTNSKEGDTTCTWVHGFSMATLLFWCDAGGLVCL